jgi:diguanylate cyclase (GGDEF)-like protein
MPVKKPVREKNVSPQNNKERIDRLNRKSWGIMVSDPRKALSLSKEAHSLAEQREDKHGLADSFLNLGWCHTSMAEYKPAVDFLMKSLEIYRLNQLAEGEMKALNGLGVVFHRLNQFETSLVYFTQSLEISRREENGERQIAVLNNIGEMHWDLGNYEEALNHFIMSLNLAEKIGDEEKISQVLINVGLSYRNLEKYEQAIDYLNQSLELSRKASNRLIEARCLNAIGSIHQKMDRDDEAVELFKESLEICLKTEDKLGQIETLINLGEFFEKAGDTERALKHFLKAIKMCEKITAGVSLYKINKIVSRIYENEKDFNKALEHYKRFYSIEKEIFNEETEKKVRNLNIQYQIEKSQREFEIYRLRNIELHKKSRELEESNRRITFISTMGQKITASLDLKKIMTLIYISINNLMDAHVFGIALYNSEDNTIEYKMFIENSKPILVPTVSMKSKDSLAVWCLKNRKEILMNDIAKEHHDYTRRRTLLSGDPASSLIYLPLIIGERIIGVLTVQSLRKNAYTNHHVEAVRALASYIAIALENSTIHEKLNRLHAAGLEEKNALEKANQKITHMANHDNLTSLPNRRLLRELMDQVILQARRRKEFAAVLYIDLDRFKPVNDSFGHEVGDEVLKTAAKRLIGQLRAMDIVARIGGDEFLAVLQNIKSRKAVQIIAKKIIRKVSEPIEVLGHTCHIGASIGICIYPLDGENLDELIKTGDRAMYRAKEAGRGIHTFASRKPLVVPKKNKPGNHA